MEQEIWRPVVGYENIYEVSSLGRVKSLGRYVKRKGDSVCWRSERILKQYTNRTGYLNVVLKHGKQKHYQVHRLVAEAFIPNPYNLPEVNHKDETPTNNVLSNLEWISRIDNIRYGTGIKRSAASRLNHKSFSKQVICVETGVIYESMSEAQRQTGLWCTHISRCCNGKQETCGGYHWTYTNN